MKARKTLNTLAKIKIHPLCFTLGCFAWLLFFTLMVQVLLVIFSVLHGDRFEQFVGMMVSGAYCAGGTITLIWMSAVLTLLEKIAGRE